MLLTSPIEIPLQLDEVSGCCRAVVETPAASRAKFDYDPTTGLFELAGILPAGMAFPLNFGFLPSTRGQDGDPLDILILGEDGQPLPVGCLVTVKLLGVIEAEQTDKPQNPPDKNDRLIGRLAASRGFASVNTVGQLGNAFTDELARFFQAYNHLKGRRFTLLGMGDAERAIDLIKQSFRKLCT